MSKLLDPLICPDCRAPLADRTCTGCGLALTGPLAARLWEHMVAADGLVEQLRTSTEPAREVLLTPCPAPAARPAPPKRGLSTLSAQAILLGVGGLCLLVAAAVFVAVSWSALGLTGRTLVMTAVTGAVGTVAAVLTRRGLRGGAETLWLLTTALIAVDLVAARGAGLLGDLDLRHVAGLVGGVLVVVSVAASAWALTTSVRNLTGMVGVSGFGVLLLTAGEAWTAGPRVPATAASVPLLVGAALLASQVAGGRLRPTAHVVSGVGALSWLVLVLQGVGRTGADLASWWGDLRGWPLLVGAVWAAVPAALRRVPEPARYVGASASLVALVVFVLGGTAAADPEVLLLSGTALGLALVTAYLPLVWARPAAVMTAAAALVALADVATRPFAVLVLLPSTGPARSANLHERLPSVGSGDVSAWTAPVVALVAALCLLSLHRHLPERHRATALRTWLVTAPTLVAHGLVTALMLDQPELLPAVGAWSALVVLSAALTYVGRGNPVALAFALAATGYLLVVGLRLAAPSHLLVAVSATTAALVLAVAAARAGTDRLAGALVPLLAGGAVLQGGFAAMHWPYVAHATGNTAGLTLSLVAAVAGILAARAGRTPATRQAIEGTALACAAVAPFLPIDDTVVAATVTVAGSAVALVSILHRDRDLASWLATVLLGAATVIRLADHASAPELVVVPAALLLLAAGARRLLSDEDVTSWRALGSGLVLGLLPSLLLALDEPVSLRGALVAAAGVTALAVGVVRRWGAPFLAGAAVVAVLAVRHLGPVAEALPRWISLGSVGVALLLVGITWEARRHDAAAAERYLTALR